MVDREQLSGNIAESPSRYLPRPTLTNQFSPVKILAPIEVHTDRCRIQEHRSK